MSLETGSHPATQLTLHGRYACVPICVVTLLTPLPSRYGPAKNVAPEFNLLKAKDVLISPVT